MWRAAAAAPSDRAGAARGPRTGSAPGAAAEYAPAGGPEPPAGAMIMTDYLNARAPLRYAVACLLTAARFFVR